MTMEAPKTKTHRTRLHETMTHSSLSVLVDLNTKEDIHEGEIERQVCSISEAAKNAPNSILGLNH